MSWAGTVHVSCDGVPLNPRYDLANHSPDGFEYGYNGSGPSQLALAILANEFDDEIALRHYQAFKFNYIALLERDKDHTFDSDQLTHILMTLGFQRVVASDDI